MQLFENLVNKIENNNANNSNFMNKNLVSFKKTTMLT